MNTKKRRIHDVQTELRQVKSAIAKADRQIDCEKKARGYLASNDLCAIWRAIEQDLRRRGAISDQSSHVGQTYAKADVKSGIDINKGRVEDQKNLQYQQMLANRDQEMTRLWLKCRSIYNNIRNDRNAVLFRESVDIVRYNVPDYYDVIKKPMDLSIVGRKLGMTGGRRESKREYKTFLEFKEDMELIWSNCRMYNAQGHKARNMGDALCDLWKQRWREIEQGLKKIEEDYPLDGIAPHATQPSPPQSPPVKRARATPIMNQRAQVSSKGKHPPGRLIRSQESAQKPISSVSQPQIPDRSRAADGPGVMLGHRQRMHQNPALSQPNQRSQKNAGAPSQSASAAGGRPAVSAPVPAKPSSSPSDRGSSPSVSRVQETSYSQLIRCTASLVDECKKWPAIDELHEKFQGFALRRKVSMQLEKLPGSCKLLDSIQDIVSQDLMAIDGEPVDLDSLSEVSVAKLWDCLEKNSATATNGTSGKVDAANGRIGPGSSQPAGLRRGHKDNLRLDKKQIQVSHTVSNGKLLPGARVSDAIPRQPGGAAQHLENATKGRMVGTKRKNDPGRQAQSGQAIPDADKVPPAPRILSEEEKRSEAARIIRESEERDLRAFQDRERKRLDEERRSTQRRALEEKERIQKRAADKLNFLTAISGVVRKIDLYEHESSYCMFKDMGVTDDLSSFKFNLEARYTDSWANTDDESSTDGEMEQEEKEEGEL